MMFITMFNIHTMTKKANMLKNKVHPEDYALIQSYGGPTKVARMIGLKGHAGSIRVWNWQFRGIPAEIKLQYPEIFLRDFVAKVASNMIISPIVPPMRGNASPEEGGTEEWRQ